MKKIAITSSIALLALGSPAYAGDENHHENPGLSAYLAERPELPPPPKLEFPFPQGAYVSGMVGAGKMNELDIKTNAGVSFGDREEHKRLNVFGGSIGYLFYESGWFNQIDVQYMKWEQLNMTSRGTVQLRRIIHRGPPGPRRDLPGTLIERLPGRIESSIRTQTGMAKLYSTLNIGHRVFPYIVGGLGVYHNKAPAHLYVTTETGLQEVNNLVQPSSLRHHRRDKNVKTGLAGSAGLGVRFRISYQLMLDVNYSYSYLGKLPDWDFAKNAVRVTHHPTPRRPAYGSIDGSLNGSNLRGHSIGLSLLFQPWGYAAEVE